MSTKPGATTAPSASSVRSAVPRTSPSAATPTPRVGREPRAQGGPAAPARRGAGAVDQRAAADQEVEVVGHGALLTRRDRTGRGSIPRQAGGRGDQPEPGNWHGHRGFVSGTDGGAYHRRVASVNGPLHARGRAPRPAWTSAG